MSSDGLAVKIDERLATTDEIKIRRRATPPFISHLALGLAMFVLEYDFPLNWFKPPRDANDFVSELPTQGYVALLLVATVGYGLLNLLPRLDIFVLFVKREPLLPGFIGLALFSFLWSEYPFQTIRFSGSLVLILIIGYWAVATFRLREILAVLSIALAVGTLLQYVWALGLPQYGNSPSGWVGLGTNRNDLGRSAAFALIHFLIAVRVFPRYRFVWMAFAAAAFSQVLFSTSATGLATSVAVTLMMVVFQAFRARRTLYGAVATSMTAAAALLVLVATANLPYITNLLGRDITLTGRTVLWLKSIDVITTKPIIGHGWGGFWQGYFSPSRPVLLASDWKPPHAHNALVDYGLTLGLVGVVLAVALFGRFIVRSARTVQRHPGPLGLWPLTFAGFAVLISTTEFGVITRDAPFLVFVILSTAVASERST